MAIMLQHVSIPRPPGEESAQIARRFYGGLVGLTEKPIPSTIVHADLVWFKIGEETELHVFAETEPFPTTGQHFCLNVSDVEAMRKAISEGGYETWLPDSIQGRPRFFCRDPFKNIIEFTQIVDDYMKYQRSN
ncbi:MAG: glyoxalase [Anaerolineae bacterium]|nr:glyoxalase [Anaerolineae bacterium]